MGRGMTIPRVEILTLRMPKAPLKAMEKVKEETRIIVVGGAKAKAPLMFMRSQVPTPPPFTSDE